MAAAVQFHGQASLRTVKIKQVAAARVLAAELEVVETTVAQQAPQTLLRVGGFLSQPAGEFSRFWRSRAAGTPPPPPPPPAGSGGTPPAGRPLLDASGRKNHIWINQG